MRLRIFITTLFATFGLTFCGPPLRSVPVETAIPYPNLTNTPLLAPTETEVQLPYDDSVDNREYCQSPDIFLSASETLELSDDEIAGKLIELWLAYFHVPQAPGYCRIDGYHIGQIYYDERTPDLPLEPKGDFIRVVNFSIKLVQMPNQWMSWPGEIDQQNWLHTGRYVAVFRADQGYTLKFANP